MEKLPNYSIIPDDITTVYNASYMFYNCQSIKEFPNNFSLHKNLIDISYMFCNAFTKYSVEYNKNIFKNGFYYPRTINISHIFENCKTLYGYVQSKTLWYNIGKNWNSTDAFKNCKQLENYNYIPSEWGGGGELNKFVFTVKITSDLINTKIYIPISIRTDSNAPQYIYCYVDYGDGTPIQLVTKAEDLSAYHIYNEAREYDIAMWGVVQNMNLYMDSTYDTQRFAKFKSALIKIKNWGNLETIWFIQTFAGCTNLIEIPKGDMIIPFFDENISTVLPMYGMFSSCTALTDQALENVTFPYKKIDNIKTTKKFDLSLFGLCNGLNNCTKYPKFIENDILNNLYKLSKYVDINDNIIDRFTLNTNSIFNTNRFSSNDVLKNFYLNNTMDPTRSQSNTPITDKNGQQISALVQQENYYYTSDGRIDYDKPCEINTYIIPRYTWDDLMHYNIFFKAQTQTLSINNIYSSSYVTTIADKPYKILYEDITKNVKFNFKKFIEDFNKNNQYGEFGPKYVENTYNEEEVYCLTGKSDEKYGVIYEKISGTYIMEFKQLDGLQVNLIKYTFKNHLPLRSVTCLTKYRSITLEDLKNNSKANKNYYTENGSEFNVFVNDVSSTYTYTSMIQIPQEERYRALLSNRGFSSICRMFGWNPYSLYVKEDEIETHNYVINKNTTIAASNKIALMYEHVIKYYITLANYLYYDSEYIDFYYQSTKTPNTTSRDADRLDISIVPILLLSGYNYVEGINKHINPPISKYLSSVVLDENGYTRGIAHFADIMYERDNPTTINLSQTISINTQGLTTTKVYGYIPSTFILSTNNNLNIVIGYGFDNLAVHVFSYAESDLIIPSSVTQFQRMFTGNRSQNFNGDYKFLKFDDASNANSFFQFFSSNPTISGDNICDFKFEEHPNITLSISEVFSNCTNLTHVPLSSFNVSETLRIATVENLFNKCVNLTEIPEGLNFASNISNTKMNNLFYNCTSLTAIENNNIFCCPYITKYTNVFSNCTNLTTISPNVTLPSTFRAADGLFNNCSSLISDISNIFPSELQPGTIDISNMFNGCINIIGTVPKYLWTDKNIEVIGDHAFKGCVNLSNYNSLPDNWKN